MKSKISIVTLVLFLAMSFAFVSIYKRDNEKIEEVGVLTDYEVDMEGQYSYYIDEIIRERGKLIIDGWVAEIGSDLDYCNRKIVLIDERKKVYAINTIMIQKDSVTSFYNDGHYYGHSGVKASIKESELAKLKKCRIGMLVGNRDNTFKLVITDKEV